MSNRSVLIVDASEETREVLRTALAPAGTKVLEATGAEQGLRLAREHHPDVIVLDLEIDAAASEPIASGFSAQSTRHRTPLVLLGSARRLRQTFPAGQFVAKPYHYAPLIRRIEELLREAPEPRRRSA